MHDVVRSTSSQHAPSGALSWHLTIANVPRERGATTACTKKEFFTEKWWYYSIMDAQRNKEFMDMNSIPSRADVASTVAPAKRIFALTTATCMPE